MALAQVKLIVDVTLLAGSSVALMKFDAGPDQQDGWFIPNDQLVEPEDPYDAARRMVGSQVGVDVDTVKLIDIESFKGRDGSWHLAVHFRASVASETPLRPGPGVAETKWCPTTDLPPASAVAHHGWYLGIIKQAIAAA